MVVVRDEFGKWPGGLRASSGCTSALREDFGVSSRAGGRWTI